MTDPHTIVRTKTPYRGMGLAAALLLWSLLWLSLNTGYWAFITHQPWFELGAYRAILPLIVVELAIVTLIVSKGSIHWRPIGPTLLVLVYGLIGLIGTFFASPVPWQAAYWGVALAGAPLVLLTQRPDGDHVRKLVQLNWIAVGTLLGLLFILGLTQYGLWEMIASGHFGRLFQGRPAGVGVLWANSNGTGRFAAIVGLLTFSRILTGRKQPIWFVGFVLALGMLAVTISRSSIIGFTGATILLFALHQGAKRTIGVGSAITLGLILSGAGAAVLAYLSRGQSTDALTSLSGRTPVWQSTIDVMPDSPLVGFGFQADRLLFDGAHVHNAWLQALFQAGSLGLAVFIMAWLVTAWAILRLGLFRRFRAVPEPERLRLIEATVVLAFLSVRTLTESTAAFFGVDLLLFLPLAAYVHGLSSGSIQPVTHAPVSESRTGGLRVLASAFDCAPPGSATFDGGESQLGWQVVNQVAKRNEVHVLVSAEHRDSIGSTEAPPENLTFHFVALPRWLDWMRDHQGTIQFYAYMWQVKAYFVAEDLHNKHGFDLFHHVTYANDWMASHAGALLDVPYIRGPGGGAHKVPAAFQGRYGWRFRVAQWLRTALQKVLRADPFFLVGRERAGRILVCMEDSIRAVPRRLRAKVRPFPVVGIDAASVPQTEGPGPDRPFTVSYVGKLLTLKGLDMGIEAFARFARFAPDARLVIAGDGPDRDRLEAQVRRCGIEDRVTFLGWVDHDTALHTMAESDVFLFPSLRDGGGAVVVEAMATGTPVVCLDLGGPGLHVTADTGVRVAAESPVQAVNDMAWALLDLHHDEARRTAMGEAARARALQTYDWGLLGSRLTSLYQETIWPGPKESAQYAASEPMETFELLDARISSINMADALAFVASTIEEGRREHVCVCSVNMIMQARQDAVLRKALDTAGMVTPDGYPLTRVGRRRSLHDVGRVRGTDLTRHVMGQAARMGHRVYLYGGAPGVPEKMAEVLQGHYPGIDIVGTHSPPFRSLTPDEDEEELARINAATPDIVLVGIGCPKQERWMVRNRSRLDAPVLIGIGAAFDFIAGSKKEAPRAVQRSGLEWLWRFVTEPRRLWRRVIVEGPLFLGLLAAEEMKILSRRIGRKARTDQDPDAGG